MDAGEVQHHKTPNLRGKEPGDGPGGWATLTALVVFRDGHDFAPVDKDVSARRGTIPPHQAAQLWSPGHLTPAQLHTQHQKAQKLTDPGQVFLAGRNIPLPGKGLEGLSPEWHVANL